MRTVYLRTAKCVDEFLPAALGAGEHFHQAGQVYDAEVDRWASAFTLFDDRGLKRVFVTSTALRELNDRVEMLPKDRRPEGQDYAILCSRLRDERAQLRCAQLRNAAVQQAAEHTKVAFGECLQRNGVVVAFPK
jgi:hypothetical protein